MTIAYKDIYNKVLIDGYNFPNIFKNQKLVITNLEKITDNYDLHGFDRLDSITFKEYDDAELYWILLILNGDKITNPLTLKFNYIQLFRSLSKTFTLNPVRFIKTDLPLMIQNVVSSLILVNDNRHINLFNDVYEFIENMKYKNEITVTFDDNIPLNIFKTEINNYVVDNDIQSIIEAIDTTIIENPLAVNVKVYMEFLIFWSTALRELT